MTPENKNDQVSFILDGKKRSLDFNGAVKPTTTVLNYLRMDPAHLGVKEGCAEGDCGACTVVVSELNENNEKIYKAIDSCLMLVPMLHGKQLITVENLCKNDLKCLHPVQETMVNLNGSQCGFCTPGIIMSMFSIYKNETNPSRESITDALTGNLCRCTGYRPIIEAAMESCSKPGIDELKINEEADKVLLRSIPTGNSLILKNEVQKYIKPFTLKDALISRKAHPDANLVSGATDLALRITKKHELIEKIIDLSGIQEIKYVRSYPEFIEIGAGTSLEALRKDVRNSFPALSDMLDVFGSRQIRELATLAGNIASASPIGDTLPVLFALRARVLVASSENEREIPLEQFITGYRKTSINPDEIIIALRIPNPIKNEVIRSYKVSKRRDLDISTVSAGFNIRIQDGKINNLILAFGGMAARTSRAVKTEEFLAGLEWDRKNVGSAMEILMSEFTPLSDARSGAEFRRLAARNLLLKFWSETNFIKETEQSTI